MFTVCLHVWLIGLKNKQYFVNVCGAPDSCARIVPIILGSILQPQWSTRPKNGGTAIYTYAAWKTIRQLKNGL